MMVFLALLSKNPPMTHKNMSDLYYTPATVVTHCSVEKKSKFITNVVEVKSKDEAVAHLRAIADREVGASHNCFAYIIGNPSSPEDISCSDDGELSGTAGKPLLNILLHGKIGNVLVVVTRYFGGIKLGSGGLVRAYSHGLKMALQEIVLQDYVERVKLRAGFHYQFEGVMRQVCKENDVVIVDTKYEEDVRFFLEVAEKNVETFIAQLQEVTSGRTQLDYQK